MNKKLYRSSSNKIIAGVCSGIADYFGIDPAIIRLLFLLFLFCGFGIFFYVAAWIIVPPDNKIYPENDKIKRLYRSQNQKIVAGVCGGIAEYFDKDPVLIRLLVVFLFLLGGIGFLTYLIAWIIIPYKEI